MVARPRHATEVVHVFILKAVSVHSSVIGQMNSYSVCTSSVSLIMVAHHFDGVTHSDHTQISLLGL